MNSSARVVSWRFAPGRMRLGWRALAAAGLAAVVASTDSRTTAAEMAGEPTTRGPARAVRLQASQTTVGRWEKIVFDLAAPTDYANPFDPEQVDLAIELRAPDGAELVVPAFFYQPYQRELLGTGPRARSWVYPAGPPGWQARFAPGQIGQYRAVAVLRDRRGTLRSAPVTFRVRESNRKGFLRVSRRDPRWLEYSNGEPFFAIGQNLAFIGEGQFVTLSKAEEIFGKLSANGANYLRIWTCCEDWAMAIEARKSAWCRSWGGRGPIVPMPNGSDETARLCVKWSGEAGTTLEVNPSHNVALRPRTPYVLSARVRTDDGARVQLECAGRRLDAPLSSAAPGWAEARLAWTTGPDERWLGRTLFRLESAGTAWIDGVSLREASGGPELLWEADPNRPARGVYNPIDCFMLDEIVAAAERNGLHLQLCLITRNLYMDDLKDPKSPAYDRAVGDAKNLLRYAVARWGYSTSVAGWEYFNEQDPGLPTDRFYNELGEFLEQVDVYGHLRSTSTWAPSPRDMRLEKLDIADLHFYLRPDDYKRLPHEAAAALDRATFLRQHAPAKPALLGEFGLANEQWQPTEEMQHSHEVIDFHNALWASALSGTSGTALFWWWDRLDPRDHYPHYRPLATFLRGVPWTTAELKPAQVKAAGGKLHVQGLCGRDRAYLWLFDPDASWASVVVQGRTPGEVRGATIELDGLAPGKYRVFWWDTYEGKVVAESPLSSSGGTVTLAVPAFRRDIACRIQP